MKVFISSTVYDLIDVRAELKGLLTEIGVDAVLSDDKLSAFEFAIDANSIETCLINVDNSDAVIVILDQRYGPSLKGAGFDDVSATHLEYRRARESRRTILFYVRDRLEADYNIHRNNSADVRLSWVRDKKDHGLFQLLDEHRALSSANSNSNWVVPFTCVTDLKQSIRRYFEPKMKPQVLIDAIHHNRFPVFTFKTQVFPLGNRKSFSVILTNAGLSPAFSFSAQWIGDKPAELIEFIAPATAAESSVIVEGETQQTRVLIVSFQLAIGVLVRDTFELEVTPGTAQLAFARKSRTYHNRETPKIAILDS